MEAGRGRERSMRIDMGRLAKSVGAAAILALAACKKDCTEAVRMGDFEFSQGNYANAVKRYEKALRDDPACYNVEGKLAEARRKAEAER